MITSMIRRLCLVFSVALSPLALGAEELQTVERVELDRYLGTWYEIARLPQIFQPFCTATIAEYSLNEDGSVRVANQCRILDPRRGPRISVVGRATPTDESNSRLEVEFFQGLPRGQYWVLELDEDYQWALVGDPGRFSLYVLSRQPTLDEETYQQLLTLAVEKHGYDISRLIRTKQRTP